MESREVIFSLFISLYSQIHRSDTAGSIDFVQSIYAQSLQMSDKRRKVCVCDPLLLRCECVFIKASARHFFPLAKPIPHHYYYIFGSFCLAFFLPPLNLTPTRIFVFNQ